MRFLLDTDICILALRQNQVVLRNLLAHDRADAAVSAITEAERQSTFPTICSVDPGVR